MNYANFFTFTILLITYNASAYPFTETEKTYVDELQENVNRIPALLNANEASPKVNVDLFKKLSEAMADLKTETLKSTFDYHEFSSVEESIEFVRYTWAQYDYIVSYLEALNRNDVETMGKTIANSKATDVLSKITSQKLERLHHQLVFYYAQTKDLNIPMCTLSRSRQQVLYDFYKTIMLTDLMGTIVLSVFAHIPTETSNQNGNAEFQNFFNRQNISYEKTKIAITEASRALYACDPAEHPEETNTFVNINIFETRLRRFDQVPLRCKGKEAETPCCKYQFEQHVPTGHMTDCVFDRLFCNEPSSNLAPFVKTNQVKSDKVSKICQNYKQSTDHCKSDACQWITDNIYADRYFRLGEVLSDSENNKVVTGVRLQKENNFYYIEIQQGKLGPNETIVPGTIEWLITNKNLSIDSYAKEHPSYKFGDKTEDFYNIYGTRNTIYLDDITPPKNPKKRYAVTGIRLVQEDNDLKLEVETKPYIYETGQLRGRNEWHTSNTLRKSRTELKFEDPIEPIYYSHQYEISKPGTFVKFQGTSLKKSLDQSTVPFIDLQEIVTNPPSPVAGAGILVKGTKGSGGYLSLKLITQDFAPNF